MPVAHAKSIDDIIGVIERELLGPLEALLMVLATILFLYGVVEFIFFGASNEKNRTTGKQHMIWGIIGLVIIVSVSAIIQVITNFVNSF